MQSPKTETKHNPDTCKMAFGRPTKEVGVCPRCDELRNGAPARKGWGMSQRERKESEERFREALRAHDCTKSNCGPICTFGDW